MSNSEGYLSSIKFGSIFCESSTISKMHKELSSSNEPHNEEDLLFCLEDVMHSNQEWVISLHQNLLF
jgi:hypothetical protein